MTRAAVRRNAHYATGPGPAWFGPVAAVGLFILIVACLVVWTWPLLPWLLS